MSPHQHAARRCTLAEHRAEVDTLLAPLVSRLQAHPGEEIEIQDPALLGRVLAREQHALIPIPAFDNSQMDGYAVAAADLESAAPGSPVRLSVAPVVAAGDARGTHSPGTATPIMTGAAIPDGADAVVPIEQATPPKFPRLDRGQTAEPTQFVDFVAPVEPGRFIRRRGEDLAIGTTLAALGTRITPTLIGALAATGISRVHVRPRARVLLCSTGDELVEHSPSDAVSDNVSGGTGNSIELQSGRIYDSNAPMLRATFAQLEADVTVLRTRDNAGEFLAALDRALVDRALLGGPVDAPADAPAFDLVVTMGGISQGAFEVVREALAPLGVDFHPVAIQPGGPQGLGSLPHPAKRHGRQGHAAAGEVDVPVLCFPGNPVSVILSLELFLAPALRTLAGVPSERETRKYPLAHDVDSPADKHQIRRATIDADGRVTALAPGSHMISELATAQLLAHFPVGVAHADADTLVDTWRFND